MPRSREATRRRIAAGAYKLFYSRGFNRVSMDEIAASAEVTKRTLYAHYDSKDDLLADVLDRHSALALERTDRWAAELDGDANAGIESLFLGVARWSAGRRWGGSGFTRIVFELADLPGHPARAIARKHKLRWRRGSRPSSAPQRQACRSCSCSKAQLG